MILLSEAEKGEIVGGCKEWFQIPDRVVKAQLKKVVEWGNEECREHKYYPQPPYWPRRRCNECWESLLKETE